MKKTILLFLFIFSLRLYGQSDANIRNLNIENSAGKSVTLQPGSVTSGPDLQVAWPLSTSGAALYDSQDNQHNLGLATRRWGDLFVSRIVLGGAGNNFSNSRFTSGSGAPGPVPGVQPGSTCFTGSLYSRVDGGTSTTTYDCENGQWVPLLSTGGGGGAPGGANAAVQFNKSGTFGGDAGTGTGLYWSDPANTLQIQGKTGLGGALLDINLAIGWNDVGGTQVNLLRVDGNNNFELGFIQAPSGIPTCGAPPGYGCGSTIFFQNAIAQLSLNNLGGFENLSPVAPAGTVDLGSPSFPFRAANLQAVNMRGSGGTFGAVNYIDSGGGEAQLTGVSVPGGTVTYLASGLSSFIPAFDNTFDLGTTVTITRRWRSLQLAGGIVMNGAITGCTNCGGAPIGPNGAIQFNNNGVEGGDSAFLWNVNTKTLEINFPNGGPATIDVGASGHGFNGLLCLAQSTFSGTGCLGGGSVTTNGDILFYSGSSAGFAPDFDANKNLGLGTRRWQNGYIVQLDLGGDGFSTSNTIFLTGQSGNFRVQTPFGNTMNFSNSGQLSFPANPNTLVSGFTALTQNSSCAVGQHINAWNIIGGFVINVFCN